MGHPTVKQVEKVIKKLKSIESEANKEGAFDIYEAMVSAGLNKCGTVFCVGGWYVMANLNNKVIQSEIKIGICGFSTGARLMAMDLGFSDDDDLTDWAGDNNDIWGNDNGGSMFSDVRAYTNLKEDTVNPMTIIIAHWEGVRDRLKLIEKGN